MKVNFVIFGAFRRQTLLKERTLISLIATAVTSYEDLISNSRHIIRNKMQYVYRYYTLHVRLINVISLPEAQLHNKNKSHILLL